MLGSFFCTLCNGVFQEDFVEATREAEERPHLWGAPSTGNALVPFWFRVGSAKVRHFAAVYLPSKISQIRAFSRRRAAS